VAPGRIRARGEEIRKFILDRVESSPTDIASITANKFGISRQGANKHLDKLVSQGCLIQAGEGRQRVYQLQPLVEWWSWYELADSPKEDVVWREDVEHLLEALPANVFDIWHYSFTEMFNNAIDHSEGTRIIVYVERTPTMTTVRISDDGIGIFKKIQKRLNLDDENHAVLELAKGKLTTDPAHHTGEGIFFTSRMMDRFVIMSGGVFFSHQFGKPEDWILADGEDLKQGTLVGMQLSNHTARTDRQVYDAFASEDEDYGFTKTVIPVRLAQYGEDKLVSRSQAKRMLARVDRFKTVILDFEGVKTIGQAFADEAFRVFAAQHPNIELVSINAIEPVQQMVSRARSALAEQRNALLHVAESADTLDAHAQGEKVLPLKRSK
jgi:anti-sigma regulatory factor (Ser/Thr protein kinase)